ncbi:MAG: CRTAC1 family protein [Myxococcota bacterium]|nr:CRTAC1 family protein [Myxococcota bacterium]
MLMDDDRPPGVQIREALYTGASFSGNERDHLWLQDADGRFVELSGVSGLDHEGDGRAWAQLDVDGDGSPDIVTASANTPALQIFKNRIPERGAGIALQLEGGNHAAAPAREWSARDAFGARIVVHVGDRRLHRELRAGEGMASQSSPSLLIGLGDATQADAVEVHWPSGRVTRLGPMPAGTSRLIRERDRTP